MNLKRKRNWVSLSVWTLLAFLVVGAIAAWCLRSSVPNIDAATAEQLLVAADQLSERAPGPIDEGQWPVAISKHSPQSVRVTKNGVYVELRSFFVTEEGLFLLPTNSSFNPAIGGDPSYRQLRERVYWYEIKG